MMAKPSCISVPSRRDKQRSVAVSHVQESRYPFLSQDSHYCPLGVPDFQALASPRIRVPAYVIRDGRIRPLGISSSYMENRERNTSCKRGGQNMFEPHFRQ